ncbi:MAG: extracellular solute-binding protein [Gemmatimonadales bacterium]|nr:extracellular solute-binding protein [Gemmatimonadales bacterium]
MFAPRRRNRRRRAALAAFALLAGCSGGGGRTPVVIYSPHGPDQLGALEKAFEALHPGIDVRWLDMGSQEVFDRLRSERANPQADIWFGGPTTIFDRGVGDSLLAPYRPAWAGRVGPRGVGPGDLYWPVYRTPAVIAFNAQAVPRDSAPKDWDDVLEPKWRDQVLIRDPMASGTMRAIWGHIIYRGIKATGDTAAGMAWLRKLDGQTRAYVLSPLLLTEKLGRQEGLVTLWDLPDVLIDRQRGLPLDYVFPSSGTVVIDDAIGLVRGAKHPKEAQTFIDWAATDEALLLAARVVFRLPARRDLPPDSIPPWIAEVEQAMKETEVDWALLAREGPGWMAYWDQRVRNTGKKAGAR